MNKVALTKTRLTRYKNDLALFKVYDPPLPSGYSIEDKSEPTPREEQTEEQKDLNARRSAQRSRRILRDHILCNFEVGDPFVTLTIAENLLDYDEATRLFRNFIKRLRYYFNKRGKTLKYAGTLERQKRGAWHFHILINHYIYHSHLADIWNHGFVFINAYDKDFNDLTHLANYVSKYLTKDLWNYDELLNRKKVLASGNLSRPQTINNPTLDMLKKLFDFDDLDDLNDCVTSSYDKIVTSDDEDSDFALRVKGYFLHITPL